MQAIDGTLGPKAMEDCIEIGESSVQGEEFERLSPEEKDYADDNWKFLIILINSGRLKHGTCTVEFHLFELLKGQIYIIRIHVTRLQRFY